MDRAWLASPPVQRKLVLAVLLAAAAACWAVLLAGGEGAGGGMAMASPTMGLAVPAFLAIWVVMMVAMMLPAAAPMILTFHRIGSGKRARGDAFASTWLFVAGYLLVWAAAGIVAYVGAVLAAIVDARLAISASASARVGGALLIAAGLYQLTPLKNVCLSKCRSPIGFILTSWRDGPSGAVLMGLLHGAYCLGCCWLLFVILFPLGIMNIAAMALITLVVFAEKALAWRRAAVYGMSAALIAFGAVVIATPRALPTFAAFALEIPAGSGAAMKMPAAPPRLPVTMPGGAVAPARR
ncbi:MAG: DUF2182 domain-containing protein [Stellaceae bacterium]